MRVTQYVGTSSPLGRQSWLVLILCELCVSKFRSTFLALYACLYISLYTYTRCSQKHDHWWMNWRRLLVCHTAAYLQLDSILYANYFHIWDCPITTYITSIIVHHSLSLSIDTRCSCCTLSAWTWEKTNQHHSSGSNFQLIRIYIITMINVYVILAIILLNRWHDYQNYILKYSKAM